MERHLNAQMIDQSQFMHDLQADASQLLTLAMTGFDLGSWRVDLKTGKLWFSRRMCEFHDMPYTGSAVNLDAIIREYYPDDAKAIASLIMQAVEKKQGFRFTLRLKRPNGVRRLVEAVASVELSPHTGEVETIFGLLRDVTDKFAREDIGDARGRLLNAIIRYSPLPIAITDRNLYYLEVSPAWARHHGLGDPKDIVGANHLDLIPNIPDSWKRDHQRVLDGKVIRRKRVAPSMDGGKSDNGGVIMPWRRADGEVGGIILMHVPKSKLEDDDISFMELADSMIEKKISFS